MFEKMLTQVFKYTKNEIMIVKNFTIKSIFFYVVLIFLSNCVDSSKLISISANLADSKVAVVEITPPPFLGKKQKFKEKICR